jgi:UDP-N-acetylglucosamine:LPS N-acetylglucosamine transferase
MPAYADEPHFYVLNDKALLPEDMKVRTYFIVHSERDWRFFLNLWEAFWIIKRERPTAILSTGAGPAVPFAIIGRLFFRTRVVFVETMTRVDRPSATARIMYWIAHDFFYQWPQLGSYFPKGRCGGLLI